MTLYPDDVIYTGTYLPPTPNSIPRGTTLQFGSFFATVDGDAKGLGVSPLHVFNGAVLSLHFQSGGVHTVEGTAIVVAPGIAIAAKHVVDPHRDALKSGKTSWMATGALHQSLTIWQPRVVHEIEGTDLCLLSLEYASPLLPETKFWHASLTTRSPALGEKVAIVGTRPRSASYQFSPDKKVRVECDLFVVVGEVAAIYQRKRDNVMAPFPGFEVRCETIGAMSGGPVFDTSGRLIGILSTGMTSQDGDGPSYVSMIHMALGFRFKPVWLAENLGSEISLLDLKHPIVDIERADTLSVRQLADGKYQATYDVWSTR